MNMKKIISIILCVSVACSSAVCVSADGGNVNEYDNTIQTALTAETTDVESLLKNMTARSISVIETSTGKSLFSKNNTEKLSVSHFAKLMTLLIAAESIDSGDLSLKDTVTVSEYANSMQGSQIWLDKGEKISVEELVKSITVGNANDACVALAERIAGSEEKFVQIMNERAKNLKMCDTHFEDCTGINEKSVSTADDIAKLCSELLKYKNMKEYLTTWSDTVRGGKTELVNLNRLVRSYKGISGMKACGSEKTGNCIAATAQRGDMSVCVVLLGCKTSEDRDSEVKKLLDMSFDSFEIFTPDVSEEFLSDIIVTNGETNHVKAVLDGKVKVVIPRGTSWSVEMETERAESLPAPVNKGDSAGKLVCKLADDIIITADLKADDCVKKMNMKCGMKKLIYNLLNL